MQTRDCGIILQYPGGSAREQKRVAARVLLVCPLISAFNICSLATDVCNENAIATILY